VPVLLNPFLVFNKFISHILECINVPYEFIEGVVRAEKQLPYDAQKCGHWCTVPTDPACSIKSQDHSRHIQRVLKGFFDFIKGVWASETASLI
jgi:hypothetical protein